MRLLARIPLRLAAAALALTLTVDTAQAAVPDPPLADAESVYLVDTRSHRVLAERHAQQAMAPASLAKLMTAYLTFEALASDRIALSEKVRISEAVWKMDGSQMFLEVGERVPVRKLLTGMIVAGGNDAARALAEHLAGTPDTFARMMNGQARALGMDHTEFTNPSGLPDPGMHTTARDMATLARALTRDFPQFLDLFDRDRIRHNGITQHNRNGLLRYVEGAQGLMTGHTADSGYHLVTVADREGRRMRLVGVILGASGADAHFSGMQALINYAFRFYETMPIYAAGDAVRAARIWQGVRDKVAVGLRQDLHLTVPRRQTEALSVTAEMDSPIRAPVAAGERLGWLRVALADRNLAHRPLVAQQAVPASGWLPFLMDAAKLRWRAFWREQRQSLLAGEGDSTKTPSSAQPGQATQG